MTDIQFFRSPPELALIWPDYRPTPLIELPELARRTGTARVFVKCEGARPLGNFKSLGGMVAGLRALARAADVTVEDLLARAGATSLPWLVCASDGNHGLAVAAAAQRTGGRARIYLPAAVEPARARRIEALGGEIVWIAGTYDEAVDEAAEAAQRGEGLLVADTTQDTGDPVVADVMAGYGLMAAELCAQVADAGLSHLFVQAGVGGLAAALASGLAPVLRAPGRTVVVEPEAAACVAEALALGRPEPVPGALATAADMLSCGLASAPALAVLLSHGAASALVSEGDLLAAPQVLQDAGGPVTTPSGAAGLAGLLQVAGRPELRAEHGLTADACVLLVATEAGAA